MPLNPFDCLKDEEQHPGHQEGLNDGVHELANFNGAAEIVNLEILEAAFRNQWVQERHQEVFRD